MMPDVRLTDLELKALDGMSRRFMADLVNLKRDLDPLIWRSWGFGAHDARRALGKITNANRRAREARELAAEAAFRDEQNRDLSNKTWLTTEPETP